MASVNKAIIVGRLGNDPDVKYMPNGEAVANISIATSESWKDKATGEKKELIEWHRVTFYKGLAEIVGQYLKKGSSVYVEGKLKTRKWTDKEGIERYTTEVVADTMQMLDGKREGIQDEYRAPAPQQQAQQQRKAAPNFSDMDDDIPFSNPYARRLGLAI